MKQSYSDFVEFPTGQSASECPVPAVQEQDAAVRRVEETLDQLEQLSQLLDVDPAYEVEPLDWDLPADFKLSVVIPVYNEETTLRTIVGRVAVIPIPKEIVLVDDYSTDSTREILRIAGVDRRNSRAV